MTLNKTYLRYFLVYISLTILTFGHLYAIQTKVNTFKRNNNSSKLDSLLLKFENDKRQNSLKNDTLNVIKSLIKISEIHSTRGNYSKSYDGYWDALILSNSMTDSTHISKIYRRLGTLYSIFRKEKKAEFYYNESLRITKQFLKPSAKKTKSLGDTYYIIASHNREQGNYGISEQYLDSCRIAFNQLSLTNFPFVDAEQAYIYYYQGKYEQALNLLLINQEYFKNKYPQYLVIFYSFLGEIYFKIEQFKKSENYYLKALDANKSYQSHSNYIPDLYKKLSRLYYKINQKDLAYQNLQKSKELSEELFSFRSRTNSDILEIKDAFRIENEHQKKLLEKSRLNKLEQQQKTLFFKNIALTVSIVSIILVFIILFWNLYSRRKSEKKEFLERQKLNKEKSAEILAIKNKELTSSALQILQKDVLISEIKNILEPLKRSNQSEIKEVLTKIKINKSFDWSEFNARFTSVNKGFYNTLTENYPELTRKDRRLCALIKLNFSSKEIAQILGISPQSVNTSRYRLRKKLRLLNDENLFKVISNI